MVDGGPPQVAGARHAMDELDHVLALLRERGFLVFVVNGGGVEFVRAAAEELYGVPPENVVGSAVQLAWLSQRHRTLSVPEDAAIVLVHALNPFGFAWRRRWNENKVDLNRNFLDDR